MTGVRQVYVDTVTEVASTAHDPAEIDPDQIQAVIDRAGYGRPGSASDRSAT